MSIVEALQPFLADAKQTFGANLLSVTLYGSGAEDRLRKSSDLNLIFVLRNLETKAIERFATSLTFARATHQVDVMWLLDEEVPASVESFAQKFSDVKRRHKALYGRDYFAEFTPSRAAVLHRLGQVLLNAQIRLRDALAINIGQPDRLIPVIARFASPLRTSAATLRELQGKPVLPPKEAFEEMLKARGVDTAWLATVSAAREEGRISPQAAITAIEKLISAAGMIREEAAKV